MDYFYSYHGAHSVSNAKKKKKKKKKGKAAPVKLSTDPQSVAARERRHRISERFKTLQCLVPGGAKMDTVSMLDEAIHYVKFLKTQIWLHETLISGYDEYQSFKAVADDASYSESFQLQPELPNPESVGWSHSSVDDVAFAIAAGQSSWVFESLFANETTPF